MMLAFRSCDTRGPPGMACRAFSAAASGSVGVRSAVRVSRSSNFIFRFHSTMSVLLSAGDGSMLPSLGEFSCSQAVFSGGLTTGAPFGGRRSQR